MGTYRSSHPMMSEANRTASIPRFAYFPAGNIPPAARTGYNLFQTTHMNADANAIPFRSVGHHVSVNAIPLRSLPPSPPNELADNVNDVTIEHTKAKKPKVSKKASNDVVSKALKPKQTKKDPTKTPKKAKNTSTTSVPVAKREKKDLNFVTYEGNVDLSALPAPFCSCTGIPRQCYRWGAGGWQSSCCTINISEYPLPMSATRPGSRMAGRKMSSGAFEKLLQRLTADGYDLSQPVDLKEHWARHGTNKFVTIK